MSNDNNNTLKENSITGETPGQLLAKQRKKANLMEREVADALKISVGRLKSIEADDFSVFPSETYIKGHLKNYSRLLKYSEQDVLDAYKSLHPEGVVAEPVVVQGVSAVPQQNKLWWLVGGGALALCLLVWLLSYWLLGNNNEAPEADVFPESTLVQPEESGVEEQVQSVDSLPLNRSTLPEELTSEEAPVLANNFSPAGSSSEPEQKGDVAPAVSAELTPEPEEAEGGEQALVVSKLTAAELVESIKAKEKEKEEEKAEEARIVGDTLEFGFASASWIQVTDATGKVLFKGLNKPGAELALNGTAPFNIVIGNVEGTSLVYNGEDVALDAPAGKKILRLTLGG